MTAVSAAGDLGPEPAKVAPDSPSNHSNSKQLNAAAERGNFVEIKLTHDTNATANGKANGFERGKPTAEGSICAMDTKGGAALRKPGKFRHVVAILALSSIVLANMNRQAYNQALSRMVRPIHTRQPLTQGEQPQTQPPTVAMNQTDMVTSYDVDTEARAATALTASDAATTTNPSLPIAVVVTDLDDEDLFDWDGGQISLLQTAFSWGYMPFMIPGGRLSEIYGAKWVVFLSGFGSAVCSIVTPLLASYSFTLLVCSRVLMGVCQTGVSPALFALLTRWLTPTESSVYLAMIKVGVMIGFMTGSFVNGFLPWRWTFYSVGLISVLWSVMWAFCVTSTPAEHKFMSVEELAYIRESIGFDDKKPVSGPEKGKRSTSAPWLKIITSPVVLAFMFTKFTVKLSTDAQSMQLPMYLKNVLNVSDKLNGPLNGANFAIQAIFTGMVAYLAKEMIVRQSFGMDKTAVRKLFQAIQNYGMAAGYIIIALSGDSLLLACSAVMLISIASMFGSGGEAVIPVDLTRKYSASIMAIANSLANLSGIVLPPIVSYLLQDQRDNPDLWRHVWWFISGAMLAGGTMFLLFVKARIQDFDHDDHHHHHDPCRGANLTIGKVKTSGESVVMELPSRVQMKGFDED